MSEIVTGATGRVRPQVWILMGALALTGALIALGVIMLAPANGGYEQSMYEREAVLGQQSATGNGESSLVNDFNTTAFSAGGEYIEHFNASLAQAPSILNNS